MPYKIRKLRGTKKYRVYNAKTKKIFSKGTSLKKAKAQLRFLYMMERKKK
jgi:hypothetical protein